MSLLSKTTKEVGKDRGEMGVVVVVVMWKTVLDSDSYRSESISIKHFCA